MSFEGAEITGVLEIGGDGLARIIDGRIRFAQRETAAALRGGQQKG